jgi:hypothetical protein
MGADNAGADTAASGNASRTRKDPDVFAGSLQNFYQEMI